MNENDITNKSKQAIEQMREMNKRANFQNKNSNSPLKNQSSIQNKNDKINSPNASKIKPPNTQNINKNFTNLPQKNANPFLGGIGFSLSNLLTSDADATLILGLLLILMSENTDKILLFALIYILI